MNSSEGRWPGPPGRAQSGKAQANGSVMPQNPRRTQRMPGTQPPPPAWPSSVTQPTRTSERMYTVRTGWQLWSGLIGAGALFLLCSMASFGAAIWALGWIPVATGASRLMRWNRPITWFGSSTRGGAILLVASGLALGTIGLVVAPKSAVPAPGASTSSVHPLTSVIPSTSINEKVTPSPTPTDTPSPTPTPSISAQATADSAPPVVTESPATTTAVSTAALTTAAPKPVTTTTAPAAPKTTAQPASVYYANCAAARAAGAAPLYRGSPGYRSGLDRDNDGVACE